MLPDVQNSSPTGSTLQSNTIWLNDVTATIVSITPNGVWMVSDGQPMNPPPTVTPTIAPSGNVFNIELDAGRQDTSPVADKFNALCGGGANMYCTSTVSLDSSPSELNFFFGVDIKVQSGADSSVVTAYLGQGSNDWGQNNWWIGGDCISSTGALSAWFGPDLGVLDFVSIGANEFKFARFLLHGESLRTNIVSLLDNSKTIIGVSPNGQWMVTNGQPMNTPPAVTPNITPSSNSFNIELDAGRSDSAPVADAFNSLCGGASNEWGIDTVTDSSPGTLNFYFGVDLKLQSGTDTSIVTVYLGQGTSAQDNNWWIGGECISDSGQLSAVVGQTPVVLNMSSTGSNGFIFNLATDPDPAE